MNGLFDGSSSRLPVDDNGFAAVNITALVKERHRLDADHALAKSCENADALALLPLALALARLAARDDAAPWRVALDELT